MPLSEIILAIMCLLAIAMLAAGLCRNLPLPFTVLLVIIGIILNTLSSHIDALRWLTGLIDLLQQQALIPDLVFFLFLPALIFESALNLNARQLLKDLAPVLALAIPALVLSTALVGLGCWLILGLNPVVALLFGALISATDPVAVVALFKELGAPLRLTVLVEGESLFNDATAIVLFHILLGLALVGSLSATDAAFALWDFLRVFCGGIIIGILFGMSLSEAMRRLPAADTALVVISLIMAYCSFIVAEHLLHVSGVMAALSAAICLSVYGKARISPSASTLVTETWEFIVLLCNSLLFLLVGLLVDFQALATHVDAILIAVALVLGARAAALYPLVPLATRFFTLPTVKPADLHIMWWGGLKGGLAIAIVLSIPPSLPEREFLINITLGVVIFSLLVNAPSIRVLIHALGIDRLNSDDNAELGNGLRQARSAATTTLDRFRQANLLSTATQQQVDNAIGQQLNTAAADSATRSSLRQVHLAALRYETEELENLHTLGVIETYTYLDLRNTLQRDHEAWADLGDDEMPVVQSTSGPFIRIETAILKRLREINWASAILSRYQAFRLYHHLQHDIAGTLICDVTLQALAHNRSLDPQPVERVASLYRQRRTQRRNRLDDIGRQFPAFYRQFEQHLFQRVALRAAGQQVERSLHQGEVGARAYSRIDRLLLKALNRLPELPAVANPVAARELIELIPLFAGLSANALENISRQLQPITFLPGDIIIGENEHGDALYIVLHGEVLVSKTKDGKASAIATLNDGAFFGERALLGDHIRSATVKTRTTTSLLRLRARDVNTLAADDPEIRDRLQATNASRAARTQDTRH